MAAEDTEAAPLVSEFDVNAHGRLVEARFFLGDSVNRKQAYKAAAVRATVFRKECGLGHLTSSVGIIGDGGALPFVRLATTTMPEERPASRMTCRVRRWPDGSVCILVNNGLGQLLCDFRLATGMTDREVIRRARLKALADMN